MDPVQTIQAIADQGLAIVAAVALAGALWVMYRERINDLKAERDEWKRIAQDSIEANELAARVSERLAAKDRDGAGPP